MDEIILEFLPDGTLKATTPEISTGNHRNAEDLLKYLESLLGGETVKVRREDAQVHQHGHQDQRQVQR